MMATKKAAARQAKEGKSSRATKTTKAALARTTADAKLITSANKKRAEALLDLIARRKARIAEDFYEIGKALRELLDKRLYVALGYASFEAMLGARGVMSATQARKLIQVVSRVPLATALKLGPEKAFALVKYTEATTEADTPEIVVEGGAKIGDKPVLEASRRDIDAETRKLRRQAATKKGTRDAAHLEAERTATRGRAWLKAQGLKKAHVEARRTKDGHVVTITLSVPDAGALFGK